MATDIIDGDLVVRGALKAGSMQIPANSVGDAAFSILSPLTAEKQEQQFNRQYWQSKGAVVASKTGEPLHQAIAAGEVVSFQGALSVVCGGAATITVDLLKNGTTILSAVLTLDSGNAQYVPEIQTISTPAYVAGDFFEIVVVATAGGGTIGQGLLVTVVFREAAQ